MHLLVCVKQTPKTDTVKIDPATGCLLRAGAESVINPFDEYALEQAVVLKEQQGGSVSVITMGPPQAQSVLRDSIARGADEVFLLSGAEFAGSDTWSTSYALAKGVQKISQKSPADLIICGLQSNDSDTGHVGAQLAAWLNYPYAGDVQKILKVTPQSVVVLSLADEGKNVLELPFPCVISVSKNTVTPRVRSVKDRLRAKTAPVTTWTADDIGADKNKLGLHNSPTRVVKSFAPKSVTTAQTIDGATPQEKAEKLAALLKENHYI